MTGLRNPTLYEMFGTDNQNMTSVNDVIQSLRIYNFNALKYMGRFFNPQKINVIKNQTNKEYTSLIEKDHSMFKSMFDIKQYYYYKYRVTGVLSIWRDFFYGRKFKYYNVFLDNLIVNFILKLPYKKRINRKLFKNIIKKEFSNFFKNIPTAKYPQSMTNRQYYDRLSGEFNEAFSFNKGSILGNYINLDQLENCIKQKRMAHTFSISNYKISLRSGITALWH